MIDSRAVGIVLVGLLVAAFMGVSAMGVFVGALALDVQENGPMLPPELEALYRQVEYETGVPWVAMAAWDGAENRFALPVPPAEEIHRRKVEVELIRRRRADEEWCAANPTDQTRCPPRSLQLTPDEEVGLWRLAHASWRSLQKEHIRARATRLRPHVPELDTTPRAVFRRYMGESVAVRAEELFEAYLVLEGLTADADEILVAPVEPPAGWTPPDGFAWPVVAPISSRFGIRISPVDGRRRLHAGIDLAVRSGEPVRAAKAGRVIRSDWDDTFGLVVEIDHQDGYWSLYAHGSRLLVPVGEMVAQGAEVALAGSSGRATGSHLHFEIHYRGTPVDPLLVLTQGG